MISSLKIECDGKAIVEFKSMHLGYFPNRSLIKVPIEELKTYLTQFARMKCIAMRGRFIHRHKTKSRRNHPIKDEVTQFKIECTHGTLTFDGD